jgi:hypothetical protein
VVCFCMGGFGSTRRRPVISPTCSPVPAPVSRTCLHMEASCCVIISWSINLRCLCRTRSSASRHSPGRHASSWLWPGTQGRNQAGTESTRPPLALTSCAAAAAARSSPAHHASSWLGNQPETEMPGTEKASATPSERGGAALPLTLTLASSAALSAAAYSAHYHSAACPPRASAPSLYPLPRRSPHDRPRPPSTPPASA